MSKILRRPMFRGGGKVSSYGNGITAPLVSGYAYGGNINTPGGIVDLPGGYAETPIERFLKQFGNVSVGTSGGVMPERTYKIGQDIVDENVNFETTDQSAESLTGKINEVETEKNSFEKMISNNQYGNQDPSKVETETIEETYANTGKSGLQKIINEALIENTFVDKGGIKRNRTTGEEVIETADESNNNIPPSMRNQKSTPIDTNNLGNIPSLALENAEPTEISAKDAIAENQELFKELLGSKQARGQDIADMLLRFSGSEGDTVGEKFRNYTRAESAAGPGRNEKISQTAAGLAINDYVAGKRSKEQIEALKGKIDYEYDKKAEMVNVQPGDSAQTALFKIAQKADVKSTSDQAYKFLIGMKTGSDKVFRIDKVKMKDLEKDSEGNLKNLNKLKKNLKIGFNIIEEDGRKNIVQWDGTNYDILSISELWEG
jgi:hypothetical protein